MLHFSTGKLWVSADSPRIGQSSQSICFHIAGTKCSLLCQTPQVIIVTCFHFDPKWLEGIFFVDKIHAKRQNCCFCICSNSTTANKWQIIWNYYHQWSMPCHHYYTLPQTVFVGCTLFSRPSICPLATFCFFYILNRQCWNVISISKHIDIHKINICNRKNKC